MTLELLKQSKELLMAVTDLASLLDQPVSSDGTITLRYVPASKIINLVLMQSREMVAEIEFELSK